MAIIKDMGVCCCIVVNSAAVCYTCVGNQTRPCVPCCPCFQLVVTCTLQANNNGNVYVSDPCYPCMAGFAQRLVIIRRGGPCEEVRFVTGCTQCVGACCVTWMTVSEPWCVVPATCDCVFFSYVAEDVGDTFCMDLVADMFSGILTLDTPMHIGAASGPCTPFSFFSITCGALLALDDNCVAGVLTRLHISCSGHFQMGYLVGVGTCGACCAAAVSGSSMITIDSTAECPCPTAQNWINIEDGGIFKIYGSSISVVQDPDTFTIATGCCSCVDLNCVKMAKYGNASTFLNSTTVRNFNMEGVICGPTQTVELEASSNILSMNMINMAGYVTTGTVPCPCPGQETINVQCVTFISTTPFVTVDTDRIWNFINPVWSVNECDQGDISFVACAACAEVNEKYSLNARTITPAGMAIGCAGFYLYEDLRTMMLARDEACVVFEFTGNTTTGIICHSHVYKNFTRNGNCCLTVLTDGCHSLKVYKYGKTPSITAVVSDAKFDSDVTLLCDSFTCVTESAARALTCIKVRLHTTCGCAPCRCCARPMTAIRYACGTGTSPVFGVTIADCRAACADAEGTLVEVVGDNVSGTLLLEARNAIAFLEANDMICNGVGWSATICTTACTFDFVEDYTWQIDGAGTRTVQQIYDYFQAKVMEGDAVACGICCVACQRFMQMIEWGRCARALPFTPTCCCCAIKLSTARIFQCGCATCGGTIGQGVWISRKSGGALGGLVSDCGVTFTPPASFCLNVACLIDVPCDNCQTGTEVRVFLAGTQTPLTGCFCTSGVENSTCMFSIGYILQCPAVIVDVRIFNINYQPFTVKCVSLVCGGVCLIASQQIDRNFDDPC